jgi:uncharacterized protein YjbI with pentapeptide repeats
MKLIFSILLFFAGMTAVQAQATDLERLRAGGACVECKLSAVRLERCDLSGRDLRGADLRA